MKRILFLVVVAAMTIGCKKQDKPSTDPVGNEVNAPKGEDGTSEQTCVPSIVLDKSTISNYTTWLTTPIYSGSSRNNSYLICNISGNNINIDLSRFDIDSNNSKKATWLKSNKDYIHFQASKDYVKSSHTITSAYTVTPISGTVSKKVGEIKTFGGRLASQFGNDTYEKYLEVTINSSNVNNSKFNYIDNFVPSEYDNKAYYSTLFLRYLTDGLADNKDIQFCIAQVTENSTNESKTVVVVNVEGNTTYYDMTKWPTKKSNPL